jgi:hypothetical protein
LKIPNFALAYDDIDITLSDEVLYPNPCPLPSPTDTVRYIIQHFAPEIDPLLARGIPHNTMARLYDGPDYPPSLITDLWYGCCAFKKWGAGGAVEKELKCLAKDVYGDHGVSSSRQQTETAKNSEDSDAKDPHSQEMLSAMNFVSTLWRCAPLDVIERRREQRRQEEKRESEQGITRVLDWLET